MAGQDDLVQSARSAPQTAALMPRSMFEHIVCWWVSIRNTLQCRGWRKDAVTLQADRPRNAAVW